MITSDVRTLVTDQRILATPYQFQAPEGAPFPHIVYNYISDKGIFYSEGDENIQLSEVQIDIYHGANYNSLLTTILTVAKEKGFYKGNGWGRYDNDRKTPYYTLRLIKEI